MRAILIGGIDATGLAMGGQLKAVNGDVRLTLPEHVRYRFDRAFGIRVGQGGPAHRFTTLNGDICIVGRGQ